MLPNPGGQLAPQDVMGRSRLIAELWRVLDRQSLILAAERRIGKTSIIRKMEAEPVAGKIPVWHDIEGLRTRLEFVESIYGDVETYLGRFTRTTEKVRAFLRETRGAEVGRFIKFPETEKQHWKTLLEKTFEDLVVHKSDTLVFFWDEVPLMLQNIVKTEGEAAAMELLDTLRALRQTHASIRMVFTGSVGLHNVLRSLRTAGYVNRPVNDMLTFDVPPLDEPDAVDLARRLLMGIEAKCSDIDATATAIARAVDSVPFYIHHVVNRIAFRGAHASPQTVLGIVTESLTEAQDPWDLRHYEERLKTYYSAAEATVALEILDTLCEREALRLDGLSEHLKGGSCRGDKEKLRELLTLLQMDHYIVQYPDGSFSFKFHLIRRYWGISRGLANV